MIFRNLDANNDWTFGKGLENYSTRQRAIGLNIRTRILSWVNDCFFDQTAGIDWINRMGNKNQRALLELDLRRIISKSEGVTGIISFDSNLNGRAFTVNYSVTTIYSQDFQDALTIEV